MFAGVAFGPCCPTSQVKYLYAVWFGSMPCSSFNVGSAESCLEGIIFDFKLICTCIIIISLRSENCACIANCGFEPLIVPSYLEFSISCLYAGHP